ncbi:RND family transporter [Mycobacterium sp.]|uniref:MMPL/RND family transporter n=1 Tax=Mycobacterium sp. TaxID=1785 RepID=UPI0031E1BE35
MEAPESAPVGNLFQRVGDVVVRWPLLVIGFWIALAAVLVTALPSLPVVAARQQVQVLPEDAPVLVATKQMSEAFHDAGSDNALFVILTDENGLSPADVKTYKALVEKLHQDKQDIDSVQDFVGVPQLREILESKDKKAWNLPIILKGQLGSPEARYGYKHVADTVRQAVAGSTLTAHVTGPAATVTDIVEVSEHDLHLIETGTAIIVLLILLIVYRNPVTMLLPLITIGATLVTAQGALAGFAELGLAISSQTIVFMTAVMVGAGTDYAVFLISRYHDYVRRGADSDQAVTRALASIGKVIAASAATVGVTFMAMIFARLPVFTTVGPAISICIAVSFAAAVTLLPAILVLAGRRGWIKPRRGLTNRFWRRTGIRIVRRPVVHLAGSLAVLIALAACVSLAHFNYDDRKTLPGNLESTVGAAAMERHFPPDTVTAQFLLVQSPHDLRTPQALADLEQMARRVSQVPDVAIIRGITRPTGEPLEQAKTSYQAGEVGGKLNEASKQIANHSNDLSALTGGANTLADSLGQVRSQVIVALGPIQGLVGALTAVQNQLGGGKMLSQLDNASKLLNGMHAFGDAFGVDLANMSRSFDWAGPVLTALDASPICNFDASCVNARGQLQRLVTAQRSGAFDKIADLGRQMQATQGGQTLEATVQSLSRGLATATSALRSLGLGQAGGITDRLANLQKGANALADGSRRLADGVQLLVDQTKKLGGGLGEASAFLLAMKADAGQPSMAGFYIPPKFLNEGDFKKAAGIFISPDGHAARYIVQTKLDPFGTAAMDQVNAIIGAARGAQPNTALEDATISMAGVSVGLRDTRDFYNADMRFFVLATIVTVLMILVVLLRAIVAPLYLIGSVVISYLSALGIGVVLFQFLLHQELHWSIPGLTFILLVAMGADYNLLLITRIRDESPHGLRLGVIRTVGSTGGVITSAGLIFAASMFGLLFASVSSLLQAGFVIGVGILLDTFVVRTITVPAMAIIIGRANWWPHRWLPRQYALRRDAGLKATRGRLVNLVAGRAATVRHALRRTNAVPDDPPTDGPDTAPAEHATTGAQPQGTTADLAYADGND